MPGRPAAIFCAKMAPTIAVERASMFSRLAILGAALLIMAPVWAAATGGGTSSSGAAGSSSGGSGGGGGAHAGGGGGSGAVGGGGGAHGGSLGAHGAAISTHAAAAHAGPSARPPAQVMSDHGILARTPEASNHKPGIPHPIFNPRHNRNYAPEFPYPHFIPDCIFNFYAWSHGSAIARKRLLRRSAMWLRRVAGAARGVERTMSARRFAPRTALRHRHHQVIRGAYHATRCGRSRTPQALESHLRYADYLSQVTCQRIAAAA